MKELSTRKLIILRNKLRNKLKKDLKGLSLARNMLQSLNNELLKRSDYQSSDMIEAIKSNRNLNMEAKIISKWAANTEMKVIGLMIEVKRYFGKTTPNGIKWTKNGLKHYFLKRS